MWIHDRACHFAPNSTFVQVFASNPVPWVLSPINSAFFDSRTRKEILKMPFEAKNKFSTPLSNWGSKRFALMRGFQIGPHNWVKIISNPYVDPYKPFEIDQNCDFSDFLVFFGQNRGPTLSEPNFEIMFRIPSSRRIFQTPNMRAGFLFFVFP